MSSEISHSSQATIPPHDETAHECSAYESHRHCHLCIDIVKIEGESRYEYSIDPLEGAVCGQCSEVACNDCMTSNTPTGEWMCRKCADEEANEAQQADEIFRTLDRAEEELLSYRERLHNERNPITIKETLHTLHKVKDLLALIDGELDANIVRAEGRQIPLGVA